MKKEKYACGTLSHERSTPREKNVVGFSCSFHVSRCVTREIGATGLVLRESSSCQKIIDDVLLQMQTALVGTVANTTSSQAALTDGTVIDEMSRFVSFFSFSFCFIFQFNIDAQSQSLYVNCVFQCPAADFCFRYSISTYLTSWYKTFVIFFVII